MPAETLSIAQALLAPSTLQHSWVSFYKPFLVENTEVFFACCALYLLALYAIPRYMSDKKAAEPKTFAFLWNVALASFSAAGVYHLSVPVAGELLDRGFDSWLCQGGFWGGGGGVCVRKRVMKGRVWVWFEGRGGQGKVRLSMREREKEKGRERERGRER